MADGSQTHTGSDEETPLTEIVAGAVMGLTFLVGFGLMFAGVPYFWVAFPVGFAGLLPVAVGLAKRYDRQTDDGSGVERQTRPRTHSRSYRPGTSAATSPTRSSTGGSNDSSRRNRWPRRGSTRSGRRRGS